jgi:hypothetical protein
MNNIIPLRSKVIPMSNYRSPQHSHNETRETRLGQLLLLSLAVFIAALTIGALYGIDITQRQPSINHGKSSH